MSSGSLLTLNTITIILIFLVGKEGDGLWTLEFLENLDLRVQGDIDFKLRIFLGEEYVTEG